MRKDWPPANAMRDVSADILEWSQDRPAWQRDALRRIFTHTQLSAEDFKQLAELCKSQHGLVEARPMEPLGASHISISGGLGSAVSLVSITHHHGVNALAAEQSVSFGPRLVVVYGPNAAGKSGYTRILKRACRSRGIEQILGNVLSGDAPLRPQATIRYMEGDGEFSFAWGSDAQPPPALARVSVFDAHCAPVYLRDKTDVAFRPFGLDVFDRLSAACAQVRSILEIEEASLKVALPMLPIMPTGTRARTLIDNLTALTKEEAAKDLAELSPEEQKRLKELQIKRQDFQTSNPKQKSRELTLKSQRFEQIKRHLDAVSRALAGNHLLALRDAAQAVRSSTEALILVKNAALTTDLIPRTGEKAWKDMWDAAVVFAESAVPGTSFPSVWSDSRCPLCQQDIGLDAAERLKHFAEYVTSEAQAAVQAAEVTYRELSSSVQTIVLNPAEIDLLIKELAGDDPSLAGLIDAYLGDAATVHNSVQTAIAGSHPFPNRGIGFGPVDDLTKSISNLKARALELLGEQLGLDPVITSELEDLESRSLLKDSLQVILKEIERKRRLAAYAQSLDDTATQAITRKSTELTKELITESLRDTFKDELVLIEFNHLAVEIQVAGGTRGSLFHKLVFTNAPNASVPEVLSEGESRTLSLAAFLAELSTANAPSAIIFDDPVSSLDHLWRERIARRLTGEAKQRQVIVFTHDLLFLRNLMDEAQSQDVDCHHQYVRREGNAGVCSPDLPWIAMGLKDRIGKLRSRWQGAEKLFRTAGSDVYEKEARDIYGLLREAWERGVTEILLNDVVERYRPSIQTQKVRHLHDITEIDCSGVEDGMTQCSRWIRGHDQAAADGTPFPNPAELNKRIDELELWAKAINQRRSLKHRPMSTPPKTTQ
jgi:hypothetical protein